MQNLSFSSVVSKIDCPDSTAKFVLKQLREMGLVEFDRGTPLTFTKFGNQVLGVLRECSSASEHLAPVSSFGKRSGRKTGNQKTRVQLPAFPLKTKKGDKNERRR